MPKIKIVLLLIAALALHSLSASAEDSQSISATNAASAKPASAGTNSPVRKRISQSDVASKTAAFGKISNTASDYQSALDVHALDVALKQANKDGAFKGTVTAVYEPRSGGLAIMNFDADYRKAISALLRGVDFTNFPDLKTLVGKDVVVSGKFTAYQGRAEIILTNTSQVKLVETTK